ncbi:MAG TPA: cation transporter, partial [Fimbriimonas sp.]|nr:cation transporter [Fimbriimonas sp.]
DPQAMRLVRRGMTLQILTVLHGLLEAGIGLWGAAAAGSVALMGFGIDSLIEVLSALIVVWRLTTHADQDRRERADRIGLRFVGMCFVALAVYVCCDSGLSLLRHEQPRESIPGICVAVFSVVLMPFLARAKRKLSDEIESSAMRADSKQTDICAYLSAILLVGLALNAAFRWWWADPVAGLAMAPIIFREGVLALQGKACGCPTCASHVHVSVPETRSQEAF